MISPRGSYLISILISVILHTVLVVAVTYGWDASQSPPRKMKPRYVEAKLVQLKPQAQKKQASPPKVKKIDLTKQRQEQERKQAEEKRRQQEQAKKEQARKEQQLREKQAREKEKARQAELERQRQLEEQRRQQELEREQRRREIEEQFAKELAVEESMLQEQDYANTAQSFVAVISSRIESNWSRPPSARRGMQCELSLRLVPTGQVIDVSITKSSGNAAFDRSALQAVKKIERFPELQQVPPAVFERYFRVVQLVFSPEDLRQ